MSEVRLVVREAQCDWSGTIHASSADRVIAALSADPVTLAELESACTRFEQPDPRRRLSSNLSAGFCDEPYDAGLVVIDLVARLVVVDSTYSSPESSGEVRYHDGKCSTDTWLRYHLADDWLFASDPLQWPGLAATRRQQRAGRPLLDARAVFYGRPLIEFIAREIFAAHARRETIASEEDAIKAIHAAWLLTPRDDLGGVCPRAVALERRDHLTWDLQDQAERWSLLGKCPPGLNESSFAYRYGGFGTHELVQYYELVRELLWSCWERLADLEETQPTANETDALAIGDFLASEVSRLERVRDEWFDTPDPEFHGRTPRSIIDRERARLPEAVSRHDAIIDPDCPCCDMVADMPGPIFWHLDGCTMDDDFAFDIQHRTREAWEADQLKWEEHRKRFDAEWAERERLGLVGSGVGEAGKDAVWSSSFSVEDGDDVPLGVRLFRIGGQLAELIVDLRGDASGSSAPPDDNSLSENRRGLEQFAVPWEQSVPDPLSADGSRIGARQFIDRLNQDFGNLREVLRSAEPSLAVALLDPVIDRFSETLAAVASAHPDLTAKCESLTNSLARFQLPGPEEPTWDSGDDIPF
jgi:hypothetical protein